MLKKENSFFQYFSFNTDYFKPYEQYRMKLANNAYLLRNQFPSQKLQKIKELLEELDNNMEMAAEILEEECGKTSAIVPERPTKPKISEG